MERTKGKVKISDNVDHRNHVVDANEEGGLVEELVGALQLLVGLLCHPAHHVTAKDIEKAEAALAAAKEEKQ